MEPQYLNCMLLWHERRRFHHGWAVKIINDNGDDYAIVVRFLPTCYWLYVLEVEQLAGRQKGWTLPTGTIDGGTAFFPKYSTIYRAIADTFDALPALRSSPTNPVIRVDSDIAASLERQGFSIVHPCRI